jgi:hypothetical protein
MCGASSVNLVWAAIDPLGFMTAVFQSYRSIRLLFESENKRHIHDRRDWFAIARCRFELPSADGF